MVVKESEYSLLIAIIPEAGPCCCSTATPGSAQSPRPPPAALLFSLGRRRAPWQRTTAASWST